jgi:hypothetical protein
VTARPLEALDRGGTLATSAASGCRSTSVSWPDRPEMRRGRPPAGRMVSDVHLIEEAVMHRDYDAEASF